MSTLPSNLSYIIYSGMWTKSLNLQMNKTALEVQDYVLFSGN
jgi:argininosuccinate synthase